MAAPKYRVTCAVCGEHSPRPVTSWTVHNWMIKHDKQHEGEAN